MDAFRYTREEYDRAIGLLRAWQAMLTEHSDRQITYRYFDSIRNHTGIGMCAVGALILARQEKNPETMTSQDIQEVLGNSNTPGLSETGLLGGFITDLVSRNAARIHGAASLPSFVFNIPYLNDTIGVTFPEFASAIGSVIALIEEHAQIIDEASAVIIAKEVLV